MFVCVCDDFFLFSLLLISPLKRFIMQPNIFLSSMEFIELFGKQYIQFDAIENESIFNCIICIRFFWQCESNYFWIAENIWKKDSRWWYKSQSGSFSGWWMFWKRQKMPSLYYCLPCQKVMADICWMCVRSFFTLIHFTHFYHEDTIYLMWLQITISDSISICIDNSIIEKFLCRFRSTLFFKKMWIALNHRLKKLFHFITP